MHIWRTFMIRNPAVCQSNVGEGAILKSQIGFSQINCTAVRPEIDLTIQRRIQLGNAATSVEMSHPYVRYPRSTTTDSVTRLSDLVVAWKSMEIGIGVWVVCGYRSCCLLWGCLSFFSWVRFLDWSASIRTFLLLKIFSLFKIKLSIFICIGFANVNCITIAVYRKAVLNKYAYHSEAVAELLSNWKGV